MDMVCFGRLYVTRNGGRDCKFTRDQKRTFMVQRALAASPLMLGGVLYSMDDFSMSLFTHEGILSCNQNGVVGKLAHRQGNLEVWKTTENGNEKNGWLGIFNRDGDKELTVSPWQCKQQ
jgi:alpha-galactosidase